MKKMLLALDGGNVLKSCRDAMLDAIENRFSAYFRINLSNKELLLAAVTMPKFKTDFLEFETDYTIAKEILISEC